MAGFAVHCPGSPLAVLGVGLRRRRDLGRTVAAVDEPPADHHGVVLALVQQPVIDQLGHVLGLVGVDLIPDPTLNSAIWAVQLWPGDRKSTRLNSSQQCAPRLPSY